jgi:hypothetical protein
MSTNMDYVYINGIKIFMQFFPSGCTRWEIGVVFPNGEII